MARKIYRMLAKDAILLVIIAGFLFTAHAASDIFTTGTLGVGTSDESESLFINGSMEQVIQEPTITGTAEDDDWLDQPWDVKVVDHVAYVSSQSNDSVLLYDVSIPTNPQEIGRYTSKTDYGNGVRAIDVVGKYMFVTSVDNNPDDLNIVDISNPLDIDELGAVSTSLYNIFDVDVVGSYVYIAEATDGIYIFDISDVYSPELIGGVTDSQQLDNPYDLDVVGDYAYVTLNNNDSLTIVNVSDPYNPAIVGTTGTISTMNAVRGLEVRYPYAYAAAVTSDTLNIINVSDPTDPKLVGYVTDTTFLNGANEVKLIGDYALVGCQVRGSIAIIDVSDPTNPTIVEEVTGLSQTRGEFDIEGNYLFASDYTNNQLDVVDLGGLVGNSAEFGSLEVSMLRADELKADNIKAHNDLIVGPRGASVQGDLSVGGNAYGVAPRMYLTSTTYDGSHNCDDRPYMCCQPGYHMCTLPEFLKGGLEVETRGVGRITNPYSTYGWTDSLDGSTTIDCNDWTSSNSGHEGSFCRYYTAIQCGITVIPSCASTYGVWCCTD